MNAVWGLQLLPVSYGASDILLRSGRGRISILNADAAAALEGTERCARHVPDSSMRWVQCEPAHECKSSPGCQTLNMTSMTDVTLHACMPVPACGSATGFRVIWCQWLLLCCAGSANPPMYSVIME